VFVPKPTTGEIAPTEKKKNKGTKPRVEAGRGLNCEIDDAIEKRGRRPKRKIRNCGAICWQDPTAAAYSEIRRDKRQDTAAQCRPGQAGAASTRTTANKEERIKEKKEGRGEKVRGGAHVRHFSNATVKNN